MYCISPFLPHHLSSPTQQAWRELQHHAEFYALSKIKSSRHVRLNIVELICSESE